jgi:hypothetical protein
MPFPPSVQNFKDQFTREFVYGASLAQIQDNDIQRAINETSVSFNPGLWDTSALGSTTEQNIAYLYLAAHYKVLNVQGAGGLSSVNRGRGVKSSGGGTIQNKSIGSIAIAYAIPEYVQNSAILGQYMRTDFGQKYLALLAPRIVGNVAVVSGVGLQSFGPINGILNIAPLQLTTTACASGTHNVSYAQVLSANGGVGQYVWTITTGSLPTGLVLGPLTGIITGTPTVAGTYYFEVTVTDILGNTAVQNYQVVIA